jgi:hypothetical protein
VAVHGVVAAIVVAHVHCGASVAAVYADTAEEHAYRSAHLWSCCMFDWVVDLRERDDQLGTL